MADDGSRLGGSTWPMPKFRFEVDLGDDMNGIAFQEVSGLDVETQIIEYRKPNSPIFSDIKMPGIAKYGNVTMKRGVFVNDNSFWQWHQQINMNTIISSTVVIRLLDEAGAVNMQWTLSNAWPTKITITDLKRDINELNVDTLEIAYEQITIQSGG